MNIDRDIAWQRIISGGSKAMITPRASRLSVPALSLLWLSGCSFFNSFTLPCPADEVVQVELIRLEHPMLGGVLQRDTLPTGQVAEFVGALNGSQHRGIVKVRTPYLIKLRLFDGSTIELKSTEEIFSLRNGDGYYSFDGGSRLLTRFFPRSFAPTPIESDR